MKFEKITVQEAIRLYYNAFGWSPTSQALQEALDELELPTRSTEGSAGYDFRSPIDTVIKKGESKKIPLFVKVVGMPKRVALFLFNRSGLSLKEGLRLDNAVGVCDSDYNLCIWYQATAETQDVIINKGDRICQGIFMNFLTVEGDSASAKRDGGFGSTGKK